MYNIIVIDDHKMLREMISETLNTRGFNVIASSGDAKDFLSVAPVNTGLMLSLLVEMQKTLYLYVKNLNLI